jgi:hypothetical protein
VAAGVSDDERKRMELSIKLDALDVELDSWLAASGTGGTLQKHHSQLLRVAGGLKPLVAKVQDSVAAEDAVGQWRTIERYALELQRVWDFFRQKLALRFVPWLRGYLVAADEYAWACYEPAQKAAVDAGTVSIDTVREPPLVCFTSVSTPFSIPRGASYARDVGADELRSPGARALVSRLPIPVIGVPWFQLRHLPDALIVGHEVGHHVLNDCSLLPEAARLVDEALATASRARSRRRWRGWLEEAFADVYATLAAGAAYGLSLGDFLLVTGIDPVTDSRNDYPPSAMRLALVLAALRHGSCETADLNLRYVDVLSGLTKAQLAEADAVGQALVAGRFANLNGPLTTVLDPREPARGKDESANVLSGWEFGTSDIRTLLAAASYAFADHPDAYRATGLTEKVLRLVENSQQDGTRYRGGGTRWDDTDLAAVDAAAAEDLYAALIAEPSAKLGTSPTQ